MPDPVSLDDAVALLKAGDGEAFRHVYRAVHPGLLRYLGVLVGPDDAEDVASETWAQACRDLDGFRGDADGFRGWVTTIGRHRALDHLRRCARRPAVDRDLTDVDVPDPGGPEDSVIEALTTRSALALIRSLPPDQAEAVMLRCVLGLDARTAGAMLGKRAGAVRSATHRGLRTLATRLDQWEVSVPERDTSVAAGADGVR